MYPSEIVGKFLKILLLFSGDSSSIYINKINFISLLKINKINKIKLFFKWIIKNHKNNLINLIKIYLNYLKNFFLLTKVLWILAQVNMLLLFSNKHYLKFIMLLQAYLIYFLQFNLIYPNFFNFLKLIFNIYKHLLLLNLKYFRIFYSKNVIHFQLIEINVLLIILLNFKLH